MNGSSGFAAAGAVPAAGFVDIESPRVPAGQLNAIANHSQI
jgi:hypothetical protein